MRVLIVGTGGQGGACASILARQTNVKEIRLADLKKETADKIAKEINSCKVKTFSADATAPDDIAKIAEGVDVVVDMVMPWMATYVMKGALKAGANYINTAFDDPYWDELLEGKSADELTLCREFKEAGLTAVFGCGFAPGMTNIFARKLANKLDAVESIRMRVGKAEIIPGETPYDWALRPWNPGWSPKQALIDCASSTYALENGSFVKYPPFGGLEMCDFPEPVGTLPVTHHSHEEIYSMPLTFGGVKNVDFKYYFMYQAAVFYSSGLCSQKRIKVGNVEVVPLDVLASVMPLSQNSVFGFTDEELAENDRRSFVELIVEVSGKKNGRDVTYKINCPKMNAPGPELKRIFGTALVYVALPLAAGIMILCEKELPKGIVFSDELDPEYFLWKLESMGAPRKWEEVCIET